MSDNLEDAFGDNTAVAASVGKPIRVRLPVFRNPIFEKYRDLLGEELFQEFAEYTKEASRSVLFLHRLDFFTDEHCICFLVRKLKPQIH